MWTAETYIYIHTSTYVLYVHSVRTYVCWYVCPFLRSFGVLLYEIMTFGDIPYEDMGVQEIVSNAKKGTLRLHKWVPITVMYIVICVCAKVYNHFGVCLAYMAVCCMVLDCVCSAYVDMWCS